MYQYQNFHFYKKVVSESQQEMSDLKILKIIVSKIRLVTFLYLEISIFFRLLIT